METKKEIKPLFPVTYGIPEEKSGLITYHICSDGVYMTKKIMGTCYATVKVDGIAEKGIPKGEEKLSLLKRKIPVQFFWKTVQFFRYVEEHFGERSLEAYVLIGYNPKKDKYVLYVPEHTVSGGSVSYDISKFWTDNPGYYIICDIHSHNHMSAFWSSTDDNDDKRDRFSMVIGKIEGVIPEYKLRLSVGLKRFDFLLDDIFDDTDLEEPGLDFKESVAKIKLYDYKQSKGYVPAGGGRSIYDLIKNKIGKGKEFSVKDLLGENW